MRDPSSPPATYEDLKALPPHLVGQLIEGVLFSTPRPAVGHAAVATTLLGDLQSPFVRGRGGPGGWIFLMEPELHLGADVVVPALAAWRRERLPSLPAPETPWLDVAPDWICEVLSPSTARLDKVQKRRLSARARVQFLWHVHPVERLLTAYTLDGADYHELGTWDGDAQEPASIAPFAALGLDLRGWWEAFPR